jgi:radical SAM superfamily enzyme YgiQ (UPF0313 family)
MKPPNVVVDELDNLKNQHGVDRIFFSDPIFNYPPEHAESICREILNRDLDIRWGAYQQDNLLTKEYIELARESGCDEFYLSPDAASETGLRALNKATTVKSLHQALDWISEDGEAKASFNFFAAVPETGWSNLIAAVRFLRRAKRKLGRRLGRWKLSFIRIEPNTTVAKATARKDSLLPPNDRSLAGLFYKKSRSRILDSVLVIYFKWGMLTGRRNIIGDGNTSQ